jgi:hypothetical protein
MVPVIARNTRAFEPHQLPRLWTIYQFGQPNQIEKLNPRKKISISARAMGTIKEAFIAEMCGCCCFFYVF